MKKFDQDVVATLRAVLAEAAQELQATTATQAKIAQTLLLKAAEGDATRQELKDTALQAGRIPAA